MSGVRGLCIVGVCVCGWVYVCGWVLVDEGYPTGHSWHTDWNERQTKSIFHKFVQQCRFLFSANDYFLM